MQEVSPPAGGELLSGCPERSQRGTRGPLRMGAHAPIFAPPWTPFTGDPPEKFPDTSGAQSLSDVPQFNPGPLGPSIGKNRCRCVSTSAPGFAEPLFSVRILAGACHAPLLVSGGGGKDGYQPHDTEAFVAWEPWAAHWAAPAGIGNRLRIRRPSEPHLSPTTPKGALSTRRSMTRRLPRPQRQR